MAQHAAELAERLERIERLVMISSKEAFNVREAALFLGLSESRVRHLVHGRLIPHYKKGANVFFRKSELEDWMLQDRIPTIDEIEQEAYRYTLSAR
jgi:excisionase family DNA binding protein